MTANDRAQPRRTSDVARVSGNASANRRWLQRFETHQSPFRFVVASGAIGRGVLHNTPRVTHNQPASNDASNYEVLHAMKYYTSTTQFNCGIDLHARQMYVCLMDRDGKKLLHTNIKNNDFDFFLKRIEPFRHDLTVVCECMFGWYWLADACQAAGLTFVLAHALYLNAIHGGKNKNDRIDSEKLAHLLRTNLIPPAYVYPAAQRPLRALLRQRLFFVWQRSDLLARIQSHQLAHNRSPIKQTRSNRDPWEAQLLAQENDPLRQLALQNELAMIRHYDQHLAALEEQLHRLTKQTLPCEYALLQSVPGIGEHLGLTILYEIGEIERFPTVKILSPTVAWSKAPWPVRARSKVCAGPNWAIPICAGPSGKRR